jgi:hypothetical protein
MQEWGNENIQKNEGDEEVEEMIKLGWKAGVSRPCGFKASRVPYILPNSWK